MTTREIYFKNVVLSDLPIGHVYYVYRDKNDVIQIGTSITLEFSTNEVDVNNALIKMNIVENSDGFMFWNASSEGEEFMKTIKFTYRGKLL